MKETTKRWAGFALGLMLGAGGTSTAIVAADCSPTVKITEEVLDAYCTGREPHVCPSPCPDVLVPDCPDPCPSNTANCSEEWTLEIVPAGETIEIPGVVIPGGDDALWTWYIPEETKLEIDWSVVAAPDFEQATASFAFRWKLEQAWRPTISASWTEGTSGSKSESCVDVGWSSYLDCTTMIVAPVDDDWRVLLGISGTFGK